MDPEIQQLIASIVIMYLVVGVAALWYRRNQAAQPQPQSAKAERSR